MCRALSAQNVCDVLIQPAFTTPQEPDVTAMPG
jgi:hypothetical protein